MRKRKDMKYPHPIDKKIETPMIGSDLNANQLWKLLNSKYRENVPCETIGEVEGFEHG